MGLCCGLVLLINPYFACDGGLVTCAGGDLCSAIQADTCGNLLWYGLGHRIALDIARGLYFLHSHEVQRHLVAANYHPAVHRPWPICSGQISALTC